MPWNASGDVREFQALAGEFLESRPVEHTALLTETAYLAARRTAFDGQGFGVWTALRPRRPSGARRAGDGGVAGKWCRARAPAPLTVHRLAALQSPQLPAGRHRIAGPADRELLEGWFEALMAEFPDDPIGYGGIVLWEVHGKPVAMTGRSRIVAGTFRLGPVHQPDGGTTYADAAFVAACERALRIAKDVLVFASATDTEEAARLQSLGFEPAAHRVMLVPRSA